MYLEYTMITPTSIFYEKEFYGDILHTKKLVIFIPRRYSFLFFRKEESL